jgi:hypothetical protein
MGVKSVHKEYKYMLPMWEQVDDCVMGEQAVKLAKEIYLPNPSQEPETPEGIKQYADYIFRAEFTNFTDRTLETLVGAVFKKKATIEIPKIIEYLETDCDGLGTSLLQMTKRKTSEIYKKGRSGLLIDYSTTVKANNKEEAKKNGNRVNFIQYDAESIINWRVENNKVSLIVLLETFVKSDDGFQVETGDQHRVLRLIDGLCVQEVYRNGIFYESIEISNYKGRMTTLPFVFAGSENNDVSVDKPPLYDLSVVNLSHYRSSADVEESAFNVGQPTMAVSTELSYQQFDKANPNGVRMGSRRGINLGKAGTIQMVQPEANTMAGKLMKDKEERAVMIGAKLIAGNATVKTVQQAEMDNSADLSIIENVALNVSDCITKALEIALSFYSDGEQEIVFELNTELFSEMADANLLNVMMLLTDRGFISQDDMLSMLKKGGLIGQDRTMEEINDEVSQQDPLLESNVNLPV